MPLKKLSIDFCDLIFRVLFSTIFLGLGAEHIINDALIVQLMPLWIPAKHLVSIFGGLILVSGGSMILLGWKLEWAGFILAIFIIIVTMIVHLTGMAQYPLDLHPSAEWLWDLYSRSNFVKNLCLLGVCFQLAHHEVGKYSLQYFYASKNSNHH